MKDLIERLLSLGRRGGKNERGGGRTHPAIQQGSPRQFSADLNGVCQSRDDRLGRHRVLHQFEHETQPQEAGIHFTCLLITDYLLLLFYVSGEISVHSTTNEAGSAAFLLETCSHDASVYSRSVHRLVQFPQTGLQVPRPQKGIQLGAVTNSNADTNEFHGTI